jgi:hypothetical protein
MDFLETEKEIKKIEEKFEKAFQSSLDFLVLSRLEDRKGIYCLSLSIFQELFLIY